MKCKEQQTWNVWYSGNEHTCDTSNKIRLRGTGKTRTEAILAAVKHDDIVGSLRKPKLLAEWIDSGQFVYHAKGTGCYYHTVQEAVKSNLSYEIEAVQQTERMWRWLADNPECEKKDWPGFVSGLKQNCHLCEEWLKRQCGYCGECPLGCVDQKCDEEEMDNYFGIYQQSSGTKRAQAAFGIASVAREWLMENDPNWEKTPCKER